MINRRTFVQTSLAAAAAAALPRGGSAQQRKIERIGLQLYSVRNLMKADVPGTLAKIAAVGFKEVEFAGLFGQEPKDVRAMLDKNGLTAPASHVDWATVETKLPETLATARVLGHEFIIIPYIGEAERKQPDIYKRAADLFNKAAAESMKSGVQFAYHQHGFEFVPSEALGGKLPYDYLLENTDPKLVKMELDLCWIFAAEQDPVAYFNKYPGRFPLVHVKDWLKNANPATPYAGALGPDTKFTGEMANVGQGSIDWRRIFANTDKGGVKHFIIEHDNPKSPLDDLGVSYAYVRDLRF
ncbi:MAG TPA: sugar phosphate isomerase/epimerase [Vicinamibacterales bacterium]|nr:sugar phosphate isomerase/epimerase [Vicinamibacterales bacterium]